jgi:SAM-dependent methyltransferase
MAGLLSLRDLLLRRGALTHVYLHAKLQRAMEGSSSVSKTSLRSAGYGKEIILSNVRGMRRLIGRLAPGGRIGHWADYASTHSYDDADYRLKQSFVAEVAGERRWKTVWDLGCNTGDFSRLVAPHADLVLAMDADEAAVERIYLRARDEKTENLMALVMNLADPSPALGWRGRERLPLEDRRAPDLVLALALIHHTTFSANIPLSDFVDWIAGMNSAVVLEFVSKQDEMSQVLLRNKPDIYSEYSEEKLRAYLERRFTIRRTQPLKGGLRMLYYATPN